MQKTLPHLKFNYSAELNIFSSQQDSTLLKKSYPCDVVGCSKQFSTPYRLKAHIRSHTGDMFECESQGCDKGFITQSDLNKHMKTHSGMKPFHCTHAGCEKVYTTAHHLKVFDHDHGDEEFLYVMYLAL